MQIKTKLGSLALSISAQAKAEMMDAIAGLAGASLCYRAGGSALFNKKGAHPDRTEAFSDKLAKDGIAEVEAALKPYFDGIKVEASEYVKPAAKVNEAARKAMTESMKGLGLSDEQVQQAVDQAFPLPQAEASKDAEAAEEAVG